MKTAAWVGFFCLFGAQVYAFDDYKPSEACLNLQGEHKILFHGEQFPYNFMTYTLRLTFDKGKGGLKFTSNHQEDRTLKKAYEILNNEDLTDVFQANTFFSESEIHDCIAEPDTCLASASEILKHLKLAETRMVRSADYLMKAALTCGIERVRLFSQKVRDEVRRQKVPGYYY